MLCAGPIGGTLALPRNLSDRQVIHLRQQHLAQALLYGGAPSAVAHIPPPPARGRSAARSAARSVPPAEVPPVLHAPKAVQLYVVRIPIPDSDTLVIHTDLLPWITWRRTGVCGSNRNADHALPRRFWNNKLLALSVLARVNSGSAMLSWTILCQLRL